MKSSFYDEATGDLLDPNLVKEVELKSYADSDRCKNTTSKTDSRAEFKWNICDGEVGHEQTKELKKNRKGDLLPNNCPKYQQLDPHSDGETIRGMSFLPRSLCDPPHFQKHSSLLLVCIIVAVALNSC